MNFSKKIVNRFKIADAMTPPLKRFDVWRVAKAKKTGRGMFSHIRYISKPIAAFFILTILTSIAAPNVAYALTSGPTAPEYTSFEPVDTTDIVNLATGDFVYNLPLLEVPGPAGGYPLSLSYHAGIQPNEEASWVGLGWTLNPGAITRTVNGYPDDQYGATESRRDYWSGGNSKTFSVGLGIAGISFGLSFSNDTYQGKATGFSFGIGSVNISTDGYGGSSVGFGYQSASVDIRSDGNGGGSVGLGLGPVSVNYDGSSYSASAEFSKSMKNKAGSVVSLYNVGASISSKGLKASVSGLGYSSFQENDQKDNVTMESSGGGMIIPLKAVTISLGWRNMRYYIDETSEVKVIGAAHADKIWGKDYEDWSFDSYSLVDPSVDYSGQEPSKNRGGSFPATDYYSVAAQGLGGTMRPNTYMVGALARQNSEEITYILEGEEFEKPHFRFDNDFSNSLVYQDNLGFINGTMDLNNPNPVDGSIYDQEENKLPGSRLIEYFTSEELNNGVAESMGLIKYDRPDPPQAISDDQIVAFKITNESGVTYHYSLPVYEYREYQRNEKKDEKSTTFIEHKQPYLYAYTWLLTAVTGPDFVDRSSSNMPNYQLDDFDWGYWVKFDYGRWTNSYRWRNPGTGFHTDIDSDFQTFSTGQKELFYLDAVETKTHAALFIKDKRLDNHGVAVIDPKAMVNYGAFAYGEEDYGYDEVNTDYNLNYGYYNNAVNGDNTSIVENPEPNGSSKIRRIIARKEFSGTLKPTPTLKLDRVLLVEKDDFQSSLGGTYQEFKDNGSRWDEIDDFHLVSCSVTADGNAEDVYGLCDYEGSEDPLGLAQIDVEEIIGAVGELSGSNVLDINDFAMDELELISSRSVTFNTDYSLVPNTVNSFDTNHAGKLTLNSIDFFGKEGVVVIPPVSFDYEVDYRESVKVVKDPDLGPYGYNIKPDYEGDTEYTSGDIIKTASGHFFLLTEPFGQDNKYSGLYLGPDETPPGVDNELTFDEPAEKTKNPPYNKDFVDIWGLYKADFDRELCKASENIARTVSAISSRNVDVWSLRKIKNSLGSEIKIEYESDEYNVPVLYNNYMLPVDDYDYNTNQIFISKALPNLDDLFDVGDEIEFTYQWEYTLSIKDYENARQKTTITSIVDDGQDKYLVIADIPDPPGRETEPGERGCGNQQLIVHDCDKCIVYTNNGNWKGTPFDDDRGVDNVGGFESWTSEKFAKGVISVSKDERSIKGGGIRVKELKFSSGTKENAIKYYYNNLESIEDDSRTSGVTSYEPFGINQSSYQTDFEPAGSLWQHNQDKRFQYLINQNFSELMINSRELQSPGVIYEYLTTKEVISGQEVPRKVLYNFQVFQENYVDYEKEVANSVVVRDFMNRVGNLKSVRTYGADDHLLFEQKSHYLFDEFGDSDSYRIGLENKYGNQGVVQQLFTEKKSVQSSSGSWSGRNLLSRKEVYPNITLKTTETNHRTGIVKETRNLAFDFLAGSVTMNYTDDGYGNQYVTKSVPAYHFYPQMMQRNLLAQEGASYTYLMDNSFVPEDFSYIDKTDFKDDAVGLVASSAQSWDYKFDFMDGSTVNTTPTTGFSIRRESTGLYTLFTFGDQIETGDGYYFVAEDSYYPFRVVGSVGQDEYRVDPEDLNLLENGTSIVGGILNYEPIWRKHQSLSYIGEPSDNFRTDGTIAAADFEELPLESISEAAGWQTNSTITLYDVNSHALEAMDINGNYAATKFDLNNERVIATVANAEYEEFAYSGAEGPTEGNLMGSGVILEGELVEGIGHTGKFWVLSRDTDPKGFSYSITNPISSEYLASFWTTESGSTIKFRKNGGAIQTAALKIAGSYQVSDEEDDRWYLIQGTIPTSIGGGILEVWTEGDGYTLQDDFRIHPIDATMTSYVYTEWGELSDILDANNLFTHYEYDEMGRLKSVERETLSDGPVKISESDIHYGNPIMQSFAGNIQTSYQLDGKLKLEFDFTRLSSESYTYDWKVNGTLVGTDPVEELTITVAGRKNITVVVTDQVTGQQYTAFQQVDVEVCPILGTVLSFTCDTDCQTGFVTKTIANGDCTGRLVYEYDPTFCTPDPNCASQ